MENVQREIIKGEVDQLIERIASELSLAPEAVADIAFLHIQKHKRWGRNATQTEKRASHQHWGGRCRACDQAVNFKDAVFHHDKRRVPGQHEPTNLFPYHARCHDHHHGVLRDSLSKGSPGVTSSKPPINTDAD